MSLIPETVLSPSLTTRYHNLDALAIEVQREYFPSCPPLPIRWGNKVERKRRRSIRLGSYHRSTTTIRIHPSLDAPEVPRFFVQSIIYHEYLHHVVSPRHDRRFSRHERKFRYFREAKAWLRANLPMLLGRRSKPQHIVLHKPPPRQTVPVMQLSLF